MREQVKKIYKKHIRKHIKKPMSQQRLKLVLWDMYQYYKILTMKNLSFFSKINLIRKCVLIDWHVLHAHKPVELIPIFIEMSRRKISGDEILLEAGCWKGGSSAKFSLVCKEFYYKLHIFDSFEGVEPGDENNIEEKKFYGEYVGRLEEVQENIRNYGAFSVCTFHKGWFKDTMKELGSPVRIAYIDCDLAKGTREVLEAVVPKLVVDGVIYSQDYHITRIKELLHNNETWQSLNVKTPVINHIARNLASIKW